MQTNPVREQGDTLDAIDQFVLVIAGVELPLSTLGQTTDNTTAADYSRSIRAIQKECRKSKRQEILFLERTLDRAVAFPLRYRNWTIAYKPAQLFRRVQNAMPERVDCRVDVIDMHPRYPPADEKSECNARAPRIRFNIRTPDKVVALKQLCDKASEFSLPSRIPERADVPDDFQRDASLPT
jgi:hypothetical protein